MKIPQHLHFLQLNKIKYEYKLTIALNRLGLQQHTYTNSVIYNASGF